MDNVLSLMTFEEKIEGIGNKGVVSASLWIPGVGFGEALSGVVCGALLNDIAALVPGCWAEARDVRDDAISPGRRPWQHLGSRRFTPNADLARDPRWGRTKETAGRGSVLAVTLAAAMLKGVQGDDLHYWQAA